MSLSKSTTNRVRKAVEFCCGVLRGERDRLTIEAYQPFHVIHLLPRPLSCLYLHEHASFYRKEGRVVAKHRGERSVDTLEEDKGHEGREPRRQEGEGSREHRVTTSWHLHGEERKPQVFFSDRLKRTKKQRPHRGEGGEQWGGGGVNKRTLKRP